MLRAAKLEAPVRRGTQSYRAVGRASLVGALLLGAAIRVYWAFLIPFNDAPDEFCHYPMVLYLAEHWVPPTMADVPDPIPVSYPAMSPLGYLPLALPVAILGSEHPWSYLAARIVNGVIGAMTVGVMFLAMRALVPSWVAPAHVVAWAAAAQPQLVFVSAYVNNDAIMLFGVSGLWYAWIQLCRGIGGESRICWWISAGGLSGLSLLCKPNAIGVIAAGAVVVIVGQIATAIRLRRRTFGLMEPAVSVATALLVCLPWFAWNWYHHHTLFGMDIHDAWWSAHTKSVGVQQGYLTSEKIGDFLSTTWDGLWGSFGYATTRLPQSVYLTMTLAVGLTGGVLIGRCDDARLRNGWNSSWGFRAAWALLGLGVIVVWVAHGYHSAKFGMSAQGRYVLPGVFPVLAVCSIGASLVRPERVGGMLLILLLVWVQHSAVEAEQQSNRLEQPDRRVRARLHSMLMDLPGHQDYVGVPPRVVGGGTVRRSEEGWVVHTDPGCVVAIGPPARAGALGGLLLRQRWLGGVPVNGMLRLRSADSSKEILARIPFRDACLGLASYRFDLRKIAKLLGDRIVQIEVVLSEREAIAEILGAQFLGPDFEPVDAGMVWDSAAAN